jgi:hypothetical protein
VISAVNGSARLRGAAERCVGDPAGDPAGDGDTIGDDAGDAAAEGAAAGGRPAWTASGLAGPSA